MYLEFEERFFGFTTTDIRKLASQLAARDQIEHIFDKKAGSDWFVGFRRRNPSLSLRALEATSAARARAFNKPQVMKFYDLLEDIMGRENFPPEFF
jgi:hypothetical protein